MSEKHFIAGEGAPYAKDGTTKLSKGRSISGMGYAACTCGTRSDDPLHTSGARKAWHVEHREAVAACEELDKESAPDGCTCDTEFHASGYHAPGCKLCRNEDAPLAPQREEPEKKRGRRKAAPAKAAPVAKAQPKEGHMEITVNWPEGIAKRFFRPVGVIGSAPIAEELDVELKAAPAAEAAVILNGHEDDVRLVAEYLPRLWAGWEADLAAWKKEPSTEGEPPFTTSYKDTEGRVAKRTLRAEWTDAYMAERLAAVKAGDEPADAEDEPDNFPGEHDGEPEDESVL